jgi:hypothetical protein
MKASSALIKKFGKKKTWDQNTSQPANADLGKRLPLEETGSIT